jgi:hypothetical protein
MARVTERERFDFERDKWRAEFDVKVREIAIKEREQASSKWRSPLTVAILAAAAAAFGNGVVAIVNGTQQVTLENSKAESTRILEMIKTGDPERAARNLDFLLQSGLITDAKRAEQIATFLRDKPNSIPVLPSASGRVTFEPSEGLSEGLRKTLDGALQDYIAKLDRLGFPAGERVKMKVEPTPNGPNAYYHENTIVIDPKMASDKSVPLREYSHHVLTAKFSETWEGHYAAIESGIADYLTCSHLNNPKLGELAIKAIAPQQPFIRNLENNQNFGEFKNKFERATSFLAQAQIPYEGASVWGGALWAIRTAVKPEAADPIVAAAWLSMQWPAADNERPLAFTTALLAAARQKAPARVEEIKAILQGRGFPLPR